MGWSVIDANQSSPVASCGLKRRCEIWWQGLITCLSDSERLLGFSFSSNPAVKWSWMFSLGVSCPSFTIKFELIALWSFKQMPMRRSVPKVSKIIQRSGMLMCQYARDCDDICSKATMTQSDEDRDQAFFGGDTGLKVSDRKIKASSSSEFTLLVCLTLDSSGTSLLLSVRTQSETKVIFFQHTSGRKVLYEWYCACGFCIGVLQCDF